MGTEGLAPRLQFIAEAICRRMDKLNTYCTYLQLDVLLKAQVERTDSSDELLFIIIHQSQELWFKLIIHELDAANLFLTQSEATKGNCIMAYKRLSRVHEILKILINTWDVLTTLTPDEFIVFRNTVGKDNASGFQSVQYRIMEFKLGLKYRTIKLDTVGGEFIVPYDRYAEGRAQKLALDGALLSPSVYDAVVMFMSNAKVGRIDNTKRKEYSQRYERREDVLSAWRYVYRNRMKAGELYQLGEKLIDIEDALRRWRFVHLATVSRVIGTNTGTGGSLGLQYLQRVANELISNPIFPELWEIRSEMFVGPT